jgi:hypothetical protein
MADKQDKQVTPRPIELNIPEITQGIIEAIEASKYFQDNQGDFPTPGLLALMYLKDSLSHYLHKQDYQFIEYDGTISGKGTWKQDIYYLSPMDIEQFLLKALANQEWDNRLLLQIRDKLEQKALIITKTFPGLEMHDIEGSIQKIQDIIEKYWFCKVYGIVDRFIRIQSYYLQALDDPAAMTKAHISFNKYIKAHEKLMQEEFDKLVREQLELSLQKQAYNNLHIGKDGRYDIEDISKFSIYLKSNSATGKPEYTYHYNHVPLTPKDATPFLSQISSEILTNYITKYIKGRGINLNPNNPFVFIEPNARYDFKLSKNRLAAIHETSRRLRKNFKLQKPLFSYKNGKLWLNFKFTISHGGFNNNIGSNLEEIIQREASDGNRRVYDRNREADGD